VDKNELLKYETTEKLCLTDEEREFAARVFSIVNDSFHSLSAFDTIDVEDEVTEAKYVANESVGVKCVANESTETERRIVFEGFGGKDAPPLVNALDIDCSLREDVSMKVVTRDELLSNAPEAYDGFFQVPKALE